MITMYTPDGSKANATKEQVPVLLEAGWTYEKPDEKAMESEKIETVEEDSKEDTDTVKKPKRLYSKKVIKKG